MKSRIIVIDDDVDLRSLLQIALRNEGYDVESFANGQEFLARLDQGLVSDLFIIDINLGGITGADICREIRRRKSTESSYVILISANPEVEQLKNDANANDYMLKPFTQKDLVNKIKIITG